LKNCSKVIKQIYKNAIIRLLSRVMAFFFNMVFVVYRLQVSDYSFGEVLIYTMSILFNVKYYVIIITSHFEMKNRNNQTRLEMKNLLLF